MARGLVVHEIDLTEADEGSHEERSWAMPTEGHAAYSGGHYGLQHAQSGRPACHIDLTMECESEGAEGRVGMRGGAVGGHAAMGAGAQARKRPRAALQRGEARFPVQYAPAAGGRGGGSDDEANRYGTI